MFPITAAWSLVYESLVSRHHVGVFVEIDKIKFLQQLLIPFNLQYEHISLFRRVSKYYNLMKHETADHHCTI